MSRKRRKRRGGIERVAGAKAKAEQKARLERRPQPESRETVEEFLARGGAVKTAAAHADTTKVRFSMKIAKLRTAVLPPKRGVGDFRKRRYASHQEAREAEQQAWLAYQKENAPRP